MSPDQPCCPPKLKGLMIVDVGYLSSRKYRTGPLLPAGTGLKKYQRNTRHFSGWLVFPTSSRSWSIVLSEKPISSQPNNRFLTQTLAKHGSIPEGRLGGRAIQQWVSHFLALANVLLGTPPREFSYPANETRSLGHTDRSASIQLIEGV